MLGTGRAKDWRLGISLNQNAFLREQNEASVVHTENLLREYSGDIGMMKLRVCSFR